MRLAQVSSKEKGISAQNATRARARADCDVVLGNEVDHVVGVLHDDGLLVGVAGLDIEESKTFEYLHVVCTQEPERGDEGLTEAQYTRAKLGARAGGGTSTLHAGRKSQRPCVLTFHITK
jgi:hypothetical protein